MSARPTLVVVGYPTRLVADHAALLAAAEAAGFDAELVAPGRIGLMVDDHGERVLIDGVARTPDVVLPRGVNRPWPFIAQVLDVWQQSGARIVPSSDAAAVCADKLATTRALARAGVAVLPTMGVAPDDGVRLDPLATDGPLVTKPARASKGRGVERFDDAHDAAVALSAPRPLVAGMVDHHVVQPLASGWGVDYRVVVAADRDEIRVVAATERRAPPDVVTTNTSGSTVVDLHDAERTHPDVVQVALGAARALGLEFGGIDVIRHHGQAVVLEANAWPGLAVEVRGRRLADALVAVARRRLG